MAGPSITKELRNTLRRAFEIAAQARHEFVTLEHLLISLLDDTQARDALDACGVNRPRLRRKLDDFFEVKVSSLPEGVNAEPQQTLGVGRVLQRAAIQAMSSDRMQIHGGHVLIHLLAEDESQAVYLLEQEGVDDLKLKQWVSHGASEGDPDHVHADEDDEDGPQKDPLEAYTSPLVEMAGRGELDPLIGRQEELDRAVQVLVRRRKNSPVMVGEPGVGKTAIAEGLAQRIADGSVPEVLADAEIFLLDMGSLLAGTKYRGQFEERLKGVINRLGEHKDAILCIDEIHTIVGAGATSGSSMDASNLLKPALAQGKIRCMGTTTFQDYKGSFDRDRALARRFQKIEIKEPTIEETVEILEGLRTRYEEHHGVVYDSEALEAAAKLAAKHITERFLPDKAIDVIDEAGSLDQMRASDERTHAVTVLDVERVVARMAKIPEASVSARDRERLQELEPELKQVIFGQDSAIEKVVSSIKLARAGLRTPDKPVGSFLFSGPTGVGKTELARQLALVLGIEMIRFDMSEYAERHSVSRLIGAPPGYVGFDQGGLLTDRVRQHPYCVVILDEIEKAHPDLFNILLQVMDHATLTDNNGREADFRNVILIMTTNAGSVEMSTSAIGFSKTRGVDPTRAKEAIERTFSPEFRNRLDSWVLFDGLPVSVVRMIAAKEVRLLAEQISEKDIEIELTDEARDWLADRGYEPQFGARPMARLVENVVKRPMAEAILFGSLRDGGVVRLIVVDGELDVKIADVTAEKPQLDD